MGSGRRTRRGILVALVFATGLVLCGVDRADPDLWGHVRYGDDVLAHGALPATATYTYTAPEQRWINHENAAEIALAFVAREFGARGLGVLKCGLGLATIGLLVASAAGQGVGVGTTAVIALVATLAIAPGWTFRPQLATYLAFAALLFLLERSERGRRPGERGRVVWLVVPLFAVWANAHGGFVAGLGALAVHLGVRAGESLRRDGRRALPQVARDAAVVVAASGATLVNPYGAALPAWLVADLLPPRPEIYEWRSLGLDHPTFPVFAALVAVILAMAWRKRGRIDPAASAVLLATACETVLHVRHVPLFGIACGFWLVAHADALRRRSAPAPAAAPPRRLGWAVLAADVGLAALLVGHVHGPRVERDVYPVSAFRFMAKRGLVGRSVVHFDWAQYAIAAFGDAAPVAFDGRLRTCYPQEVADAYFDFLVGDRLIPRWRSPSSPPVDERRILELGHPTLAVVARGFPHAANVVATAPDWVLLYQDAVAQVWGRRDTFDDPASPAYLPADDRRITDSPQAGTVAWPALPPRRLVAHATRAGGPA